MDDRTELSAFLRSRRARLRPEDVGLRDYGGARRVAGLRREELARLAGVSIAHYTRLEQGRADSVSDGILDAVGAALRLSTDELAYLRRIARRPRPCAASADRPEMPEGLRHLLRSFEMTPALAVGRHTQIVGWNRLAVAVFGDFPALPERRRTLTTCCSPSLTCAICTGPTGSGRRANTWRTCASCSDGTAETPSSPRTSTTCAT